jgi:hypothetical protein
MARTSFLAVECEWGTSTKSASDISSMVSNVARDSSEEGVATRPLAALTASATALDAHNTQRGELGSVHALI